MTVDTDFFRQIPPSSRSNVKAKIPLRNEASMINGDTSLNNSILAE
jgi:hypothetical protein